MFEKLRNNSLKNYRLCPGHYLSGLSWNTMANMKQVKFELISDADMYLFFEKDIRGEFLTLLKDISHKYLKSYDQEQDSNNLFGYVMSKFLPTGVFKWIDPKWFDLNSL